MSAFIALLAQTASAFPIITNIVETGGDNEATDTVTAKWTGVTYVGGVANEPVNGLAAGASYTVGLFGNHAPCMVDRNHRYTNASDTAQIPAYLVGREYIMSGNDNRDNAGYVLDVSVAQAVQVYMLIDDRLSDADGNTPPTFDAAHMQWILDQGWTPVKTGVNHTGDPALPDEVGIDESADGTLNQWFSIYTKTFPAGTFRLLQADNTGQNMYGVVVAPGPRLLDKYVNVGGNPIGTVTVAENESYTIVGGGNDIWDMGDEFSYAYTGRTGDFDVRVRVESITPNARWSKGGLMVRESLSEDSRMLFVRVTPPDVPTGNGGNGANDIKLAYRTGAPDVAGENGGQHEDPSGQLPPPFPNAWLRLLRTGNIFSAQTSTDGTAWTEIASQDTGAGDWTAGGGPLRGEVLIGLAASRHSAGPTATAVFHDFSFQPTPFTLAEASSRGNPNGILVSFSQPPDASPLVTDPATYFIDPGLTINSVTAGPRPGTYWLNTAETLTEGSAYSVIVLGAVTVGGQLLVEDTKSFTHGAGYEAVGIHAGHNKEGSGSLATAQTRTGYARGLFSTAEGSPALESNVFFEDPLPDSPSNEHFTTRVFGILNITTAGGYKFAMSSDDNGKLYLSTDADPANKGVIAQEPVWSGRREYVTSSNGSSGRGSPPSNQSATINLAAGRYYLEAIFTEGGGGNNLSATWQPPGGPAFSNGEDPIPSSAFAPSRYYNGTERGALFDTLGPVQILTQPVAQTVTALQPVSFRVRVDGTPAYSYQWLRNGGAILGANDPTYTIGVTLPPDDGAVFSVVVNNEFSSATSAGARLTVISPLPPRLVSVTPNTTFTSLLVKFDNRVQPSSALTTANYTIAGLTVTAATLAPGGSNVVLTTSQQAEGTSYTLVVRDVKDLTGLNSVSPNPSSLTFFSLAFSPGFVTKDFYLNYSAGVDALVANAALLGQPTFTCYSNLWELNDRDLYESYGARISGFFVPTESGPHIFYLATDDPGRLFLSTDADPAHKVQIASEPVWAARREWTGEASGGGRGTPPSNVSAPIVLAAGQRYYIESFFQEFGGGDHMEVTVQPPSQANPPANGSLPMTGIYFGSYASPEGAVVTISQQPASVNVTENATPTFTVGATASSPLCGGDASYQWRKNGVAISGAIGSSYTTPPVTLADNGAKYRCLVAVPGKSVLSAEATLNVNTDVIAPTVLSGIGGATLTTFTVQYSELVDPITSQDALNYKINDVEGSVIQAVLSADGRSVTLTTGPQTDNTVYTISIDNVADLAGNTILPGTRVTVRSFVVSACGGAEFALFNSLSTGDNNIRTTLLADPRFPNNPTSRTIIPGLSSRLFYPDDSHEGYGAQVRGLFIPPTSGNWVFYLRSDDSSILYLNPTGPNAAGKVIIQEESGCCNAFTAHKSAPLPLVAGNGYYIEMVYKEGTGGDYGLVGATLDGAAAPVADTDTIPGSMLGSPAAPAGVGGPVNLTGQPASVTTNENKSVTFGVAANNPNGLPICYQWRRDGVDIPGANGPSYTLLTTLVDNGAKFRVLVSVVGASVLSSEATLTVNVDRTPPKMLSAQANELNDKVIVTFDELLDPSTGGDNLNYQIAGLTIGAAALRPDGKSVVLTLGSRMAENTLYTVVAENVSDLASPPNVVAPPNDRATFRSFVFSCGFLNFAVYDTGGGTAVSLLTGHASFPDNPTERYFLPSFDTRAAYPDDRHESYGGRIVGLFVPPSSGNWIFYVRSDDSSELWLNPAGDDPTGRTKIAEEPGCCGAFADHASAPQALVAGQHYYIEALYKEGGGGDYCQVAAKLDTDPTPPNSLAPISANSLGLLADGTGATLAITQQPVDLIYAIDPLNLGGGGSPLYSENFNSGDGGWTVETPVAYDGPWVYSAGFGSWQQGGQAAEDGHPNTSLLTSPQITVGKAGGLQLRLAHRYSFEFDGTRWDGGQLRISVNDGPFTAVAPSAFTENGYNQTVAANSVSALHGQPAWTSESAGFASGPITTVASLGFFNVGDRVKLQLYAASDTNTRGQSSPNWEVDSVTLSEGAQDATLRIGATASRPDNPNQPIFYQWQKWTGSVWRDLPDANVANVPLVPQVSDNGNKYRATLYIPGANAVSREVTLTVVQLNTAPKFTCGGNTGATEDDGAKTVANWASDIQNHSIPRTRLLRFDTQPPNTVLDGVARVNAGVLKMTEAGQASAFGVLTLNLPGTETFQTFQASWKSLIGGGAGGGADGYSFNVGTDLPNPPVYGSPGEDGAGTGLSVTVDTYDNGGGETGLEIRWGGTPLVFKGLPKDNDGSGNYLRKNAFVDASVNVDAAGLATFTYDGNVVTAQLPGYAGITASQIMIGGRTGGANDNQWIDDLGGNSWIDSFLVDPATAEAGQTVHFEVSNTNPGLFSVQPAVSANGTLSYTPAPNQCGSAQVTVVAKDDGGTALGGHDTSEACTITIAIACVNDCPTTVGQNVTTLEGQPVAIALTATDADNDPVQYSITQPPSHGIVVLQVQTGASTYTPTAGYSGPDSFKFKVSDGTCSSAEAIVNINVRTLNHPPHARITASSLADFSPAVANKVLISCNGSNACLRLDGSLSTDDESPLSALTFQWFIEPSPIPFGVGVVVDHCLELGTQTIMLSVTDPGNLTGIDTLTVDVLSAGEAIDELIERINQSTVARKNKRPFIATLKAASASAERGQAHTAANQLNALQNKIRAQVARTDPEEAAVWIRWTQSIIDGLDVCK